MKEDARRLTLCVGCVTLAATSLFGGGGPSATGQESQHDVMLARAAAELGSPPPGDPLSDHASGFAKTLCSAVFVTGLDAEFAAENVGVFATRSRNAGLADGATFCPSIPFPPETGER